MGFPWGMGGLLDSKALFFLGVNLRFWNNFFFLSRGGTRAYRKTDGLGASSMRRAKSKDRFEKKRPISCE
jgi:hypothetical protein